MSTGTEEGTCALVVLQDGKEIARITQNGQGAPGFAGTPLQLEEALRLARTLLSVYIGTAEQAG